MWYGYLESVWRRTTPTWVSVHFPDHAFHSLECRPRQQTHNVSAEACVMSLSPLDNALQKAKKYILFDLRFGSADNCPGTQHSTYIVPSL